MDTEVKRLLDLLDSSPNGLMSYLELKNNGITLETIEKALRGKFVNADKIMNWRDWSNVWIVLGGHQKLKDIHQEETTEKQMESIEQMKESVISLKDSIEKVVQSILLSHDFDQKNAKENKKLSYIIIGLGASAVAVGVAQVIIQFFL